MGSIRDMIERSGGSSVLTLYHGTSAIFDLPVHGIGKEDNDYGSGFYMTINYNHAAEWACAFGNSNAYVNKYELDTSRLTRLNMDELGPLCWIAEVASHRTVPHSWWAEFYDTFLEMYKPNTDFDMIQGIRADDSYLRIVDEFFEGNFGAMEVASLFKKGDLGSQVFIKSKKAFDAIKFIERTDVTGYSLDRVEQARAYVISKINERRASILRSKSMTIQFPSFSDSLDRKLVYNTGGFYE